METPTSPPATTDSRIAPASIDSGLDRTPLFDDDDDEEPLQQQHHVEPELTSSPLESPLFPTSLNDDHLENTITSFPDNPFQSSRTHMRSASGTSMTYIPPGPIALIDHTGEPSDLTAGLFARSVLIGDYTVISGGVTRAGAYVVWNCVVETLEGNKIILRKRYSEFDELREKLVQAFPRYASAIPALPRKSVVSRFRPKFLENRRQGLNYFLSCVLMNPQFSSSSLVKEFLFHQD